MLWQGQLVSSLGDALYAITLNLFVLELTGSTAIMGTVMALVMIPRIIIGPFIGVFIDRYDRKKIIVMSDVISGVSIGIVALAVYFDFANVTLIILVELITAICASFLRPTIESSMADIVPKDNLTKANSKYQMATTGAEILGQTMGGFLLTAIGSAWMFFVNACSFLFSAMTETFIEIPKHKKKETQATFFEDFKYGLHYILSCSGLMRLIVMSAIFNFLFGVIRVSIIPWFTKTAGLGIIKYGFLNAVISAGMILGMMVMSFFTIKKKYNYRFYIVSLFLFIVCIATGAFFHNFYIIAIFYFAGFVFQFVFNIIMGTSLMAKTPDENRGKVITTKTTLVLIASPIGNLVGGVVCEYFTPAYVIVFSACVAAVCVLLIAVNKNVRNYLNSED